MSEAEKEVWSERDGESSMNACNLIHSEKKWELKGSWCIESRS